MRQLQIGSIGEDVKKVQERLNEIYVEQLKVDGIFGSLTEEMVMAFQEDEGLVPDGIVGSLTWKALFSGQELPTAEPVEVITNQMIVDKAMTMNKRPYIFGYEISPGEQNPKAADCSELVEWGCRELGVEPMMPDGAENQFLHCKKHGTLLTLKLAYKTIGALLFRITPGIGGDHVAISRGDDTTIEARGKDFGIGVFSAKGRNWTHAAKIPGVKY